MPEVAVTAHDCQIYTAKLKCIIEVYSAGNDLNSLSKTDIKEALSK
jgi:hypothetical protein